jgi:hypothetical protein
MSAPVRIPESKIIVISGGNIISGFKQHWESRALTVSNGLHDFRQHLKAAHRAVNLPTRVVGYHNPFTSDLERATCIRGTLNSLQHERSSARYTLPL